MPTPEPLELDPSQLRCLLVMVIEPRVAMWAVGSAHQASLDLVLMLERKLHTIGVELTATITIKSDDADADA